MELESIDLSISAAALHTIKDSPVEGWYLRIMVYFLVSCFCDWICYLSTEQHQSRRHDEVRESNTSQDSVLLRYNTKERNTRIRLKQCGMSEKRGCKTQGINIHLENCKDMKNSLGFSYRLFTGALCHCGFDFRLNCTTNGEGNLNSADMQARRTGLNLTSSLSFSSPPMS